MGHIRCDTGDVDDDVKRELWGKAALAPVPACGQAMVGSCVVTGAKAALAHLRLSAFCLLPSRLSAGQI